MRGASRRASPSCRRRMTSTGAFLRSEPTATGAAMAGVLDARGEASPERFASAVGGEGAAAGVLRLGPLTVAASAGAGVHQEGDIVCCFMGSLLDPDATAERAGLAPGATPEASVAAAYARDGKAMLDALRGSFLAVLWNRGTGEGLLAQDQLSQ